MRAGELADARTVGAGERVAQPRHDVQRGAELREVARPRGREPDPRQDAFQVPDVGEQSAHGLVHGVLDQGTDRVEALRELAVVAHRAGQPASQEPASHRSRRPVHDRGERRGVVARQRVRDLQVAPRGGIEDEGVLLAFEAQGADVRERAALGVPGVDDQRPRRPGRERTVLELERREIPGSELLDEDSPGRVRVEVPRGNAPQRRVLAHRAEVRRALRQEHLGGAEPLDLGLGALGVSGLGAGEPAAGELQRRDAPAPGGAVGRHQQVVAAGFEQVLLGQRPGGDDSRDLPLHRTARRRGVADLLADRGRFALAHQLREVRLDRVRRHSGHRDRNPARAPARGERDVEQLRGTAGVVEEQLVEIPHAVEEQGVGMFRLDAQVLRDDRGVPGRGVGGRGGHGQGTNVGRLRTRKHPTMTRLALSGIPAILILRLPRRVDAIGGRNPWERGRPARKWAKGPQVFHASAPTRFTCRRRREECQHRVGRISAA